MTRGAGELRATATRLRGASDKMHVIKIREHICTERPSSFHCGGKLLLGKSFSFRSRFCVVQIQQ